MVFPVKAGPGRRGRGSHEDGRCGLGIGVLFDGAEVGGLDGGIGLDRGRVPVGDDGAVVENAHVVADVHHEAHVVLDEQDGDAPVGQVHEHAPELDGLLLVEARARFVDEEHRRTGGQGPTELDEPGQAGGKQVGGLVGHVRQTHMGQDDVGFGARRAPRRAPAPRLGRHLYVLACRQGPEELESLEGAGDAESRPPVRGDGGDVLAAETNPALGR